MLGASQLVVEYGSSENMRPNKQELGFNPEKLTF